MADPPPKTKIAIIGSGIAGPLFALHLLSHPHLSQLYHPVIYERSPSSPSTTGAAVALTSNALFPLYQLGLKDEVERVSCETERVLIWRSSGGGKGKYLNAIKSPNWQEDLGTALRVVERGALQGVLLERVKEKGGEVGWGKRVVGLEQVEGRVKVCFEDGVGERVGLVVGADGGWSDVRRAIIAWKVQDSGGNGKGEGNVEERWKPVFAGADAIYGVSKRPGGIVGEAESEQKEGDTHWVFVDGGMASTWALKEGKVFWTLSALSKTPPERKAAGSEAARRQREEGDSMLYGATVSHGGYGFEDTKKILEKYEDVWFPGGGTFGELLRSSERIVRTPLWYRAWEEEEIAGENVVLIGDAARLMLPTSGQGACFAIEDATVFANSLLNNPPSTQNARLDFSQAIKEYVQARLPRSKSMAKQSYWMGVLMSWLDAWWIRWFVDLSTAWLPTGGDPKLNKVNKKKDPMGWIYDVRYKVELRDESEGSGAP
ncbi:FAD/NAD(P)-binding domain-containing protein [Stipitochalara longipes BDJ]|nr:FAD/NAD(P)-binding domain-containing protein [Stipitochalara longipes BDJ]